MINFKKKGEKRLWMGVRGTPSKHVTAFEGLTAASIPTLGVLQFLISVQNSLVFWRSIPQCAELLLC